MSDRVHELAEVWREIVAIDHHKHKDGYFCIIKSWSYDHHAKYYAYHNAYIGDDLDGPYRTTYAEAENDLIGHLLKMIEKQRIWAAEIMSIDENERWSEREAKHTLEVIDRNATLIKGEQKVIHAHEIEVFGAPCDCGTRHEYCGECSWVEPCEPEGEQK